MDKVKALFFSQYWGQKVFYDTYRNRCQTITAYTLYKEIDANSILLLRSIKDLTDEEIITVCDLTFPALKKDSGFYNLRHETGQKLLNKPLNGNIYQYLLRIGILLPFTYLDKENKPITLQPDEIIELGNAKYIN